MNRRPDDFRTAFTRLGVAAVALSRVTLALAFAPCAVMAASTPAFAQPADAIDKVTQLNRDALAAIDKREFEKARELLKHALDVCDSAGLDRHPLAARTHVHMGVVIIEGFKNHELGRKQFAKALEIEPTITVTKSLSTPELEEAFSEAKTGATAAAGAVAPRPRPATRVARVRPRRRSTFAPRTPPCRRTGSATTRSARSSRGATSSSP